MLTNNPIRQIDTFNFLERDSLPKLRHVYAAKSQLGNEQTQALVGYLRARGNPNATFKYKDTKRPNLQGANLLGKLGTK